jgi:hypothetical protein
MTLGSRLFIGPGLTHRLAALLALTALGLTSAAHAGTITAEVATGTNASLKVTDLSSGSNSGSSVPGTLFWNVQIGAGDTLNRVSGNAINLWGNQASSGDPASAIYFGVFAGFVTPTGATTSSYGADAAATYTPLVTPVMFTSSLCPAGGCNQYAWLPVLDGMGLSYAAGNGAGEFTIAVWSEAPAGTGGNGNVWKTSTRNGLALTDTDGTPPVCGASCTPDARANTFAENVPLPGSLSLLVLGLLGVGWGARRRA